MIAIDTAPLIWGVQRKAAPGFEEMVNRMAAYIDHLTEQKERIIVPVPVVGEYLVGFPVEQQAAQRKMLQTRFFIPSLDLRAMSIAARLEREADRRRLIDAIKTAHNVTGEQARQLVKVDAQIIGIAIAQGARKLISYDAHMRELAGDEICVEPVPVVHTQQLLPFNAVAPRRMGGR